MPAFSTKYGEIIQRLASINPIDYGKTRNFTDGSVTRLSPYIARGVLSTRVVMEQVLNQGLPFYKVEKLIQELAWRDYWQQIWVAKDSLINQDLKHLQPNVANYQVPVAILKGRTGIDAVDQAIASYYKDGYLHNHVRMYIAAIACNIAKSHWYEPARWMYYHLLDGDWASNALSWQWVAGANANKQYYANQDNINKYCHTNQKGTFLDVAYNQFADISIPQTLLETDKPQWITPLPPKSNVHLDTTIPTLIYNYYNLDPNWRATERVNRVLLLEPNIFEAYPIGHNAIQFMLELAKNIQNIQVYVGSFDALKQETAIRDIIFKEHPLNSHYQGKEDRRDWMFSVTGYYPSFFNFWKRCKKELSDV